MTTQFMSVRPNPKVIIFFTSLFYLVINYSFPNYVLFVYALEGPFITFLWFAFISMFISFPIVSNTLRKHQKNIDRFLGVFLMIVAVKLLLF